MKKYECQGCGGSELNKALSFRSLLMQWFFNIRLFKCNYCAAESVYFIANSNKGGNVITQSAIGDNNIQAGRDVIIKNTKFKGNNNTILTDISQSTINIERIGNIN